MAKAPLEGVFQHIRKMVDAQTLAEATNEQLVERFARGHDEPAFAALLRRHGPMVLSVSHGILRQLEDAEDVFQATFLPSPHRGRDEAPAMLVPHWERFCAWLKPLSLETDAMPSALWLSWPGDRPRRAASWRPLHAF